MILNCGGYINVVLGTAVTVHISKVLLSRLIMWLSTFPLCVRVYSRPFAMYSSCLLFPTSPNVVHSHKQDLLLFIVKIANAASGYLCLYFCINSNEKVKTYCIFDIRSFPFDGFLWGRPS